MTAIDPDLQYRPILEQACTLAGIDAANATPLRFSENAIYKLSGPIIARVGRPGQHAAAVREVQTAQWLESSGLSAVQTIAGIEQPVIVADRPVTFWQELPDHRHGTIRQVAIMIRELHHLSPPTSFPLGHIEPFVRLDQRIESAASFDDIDRAWMRNHLTRLRERWETRTEGLPWCVIHGDAWVGNVVSTDDGRTFLLDLERTSIGPPEWDLVHAALKHHSFGWGDHSEYQDFCETYGHDVTAWSGFELLRDIREFRMTCMAVQSSQTNPADRDQALHRLSCLQGEHGARPWAGWRPLA
ncbi:phosphotransferase family protein [Nocardia miyunensis]|uniref:phosphotransferase family protein n=1 Tax=Nocardia miyunensis TaxID=282684 RepID=UPI0008376416|nr:aminoglycoside phosphotransferase family protein [Nocardia miyunensis]